MIGSRLVVEERLLKNNFQKIAEQVKACSFFYRGGGHTNWKHLNLERSINSKKGGVNYATFRAKGVGGNSTNGEGIKDP
jgi:hypothetical protein